MPQFIIIRGLPGSGKTTLANWLPDFVHFEADQFMVDDEGNHKFDHNRLAYCHRKCEQEVSKHLMLGHNVVVSNTFVQMWEIQKYLEIASHLNISPLIVECKGQFQDTHNVPINTIEWMRRRWEPLPMFAYTPGVRNAQ